MTGRYRKPATTVLVLVIALAFVASNGPSGNTARVRAASCVVTSTMDDMTTSGTLRDAIHQVTIGACDKAITFDTTVFATAQTITLAQTLTLSHNITIQGPGAKLLTVSGNGTRMIFTVNGGIAVSLSSLTIAGGQSESDGGGIANNGTLSVQNCAFSGNNAGGRGGAIANSGTLSVVGSTFTGNHAGQGGGIYNGSGMTLTVVNSTLSGNTATGQGGGIADDGGATVTAATFTGNTATDGGGIAKVPSATGLVTRIIAAGNTATDNPDYADTYNVPTSGSNVIGGMALLDSQLRDNGTLNGTQTDALLPGSPALSLIVAPCPITYTDAVSGQMTLTTDQRGVPRPTSDTCDGGAFESQGFTVTKTAGDNGIAAADGTFGTRLAVAVSSTASEPFAGGQITFRIMAGSSGVSGAFATTGTNCAVTNADPTIAVCPIAADGTAIAPALTASRTAGVFTVTAGARGIAASAIFTLAYPTTLTGITRATVGLANGLTNAGTVKWSVTFADPVSDVTAGNFTLAASGVTSAAITSVTADSGGGNRTWTVAATTGTGDGALGLAFANGGGATPPASNAPFNGESYTIDKTGPVITPPSLPNAEMGRAYTQTLIATDAHTPAFTGITGALPPGLVFAPATGILSGTPTGVGSFAFTVTAMDAVGNTTSRSFTMIVLALGPRSGDVRGGTMTIGGAGFGNGTIVTVDGTAVTPVNMTPTQITLTMPPHAAATVPVVVTTGGVTTTLIYTYGIVNATPTARATAVASGTTPQPMPLPHPSVLTPPGAATPLPAPARH